MAVLFFGHRVLAIEHRGANRHWREDVNPIDAQVALGAHVARASIVQRDMTPAAVQPSDPVVALDLLAALGALARRVALHPMVEHLLSRPRGLDVRGDAGGRSPLDAPLVNRVFAH